MEIFENINPEARKKIVQCWSKMDEMDRSHFINQISLGLSVWGDDDTGTKIAVEVLESLVKDGAQTLSDFGLYLEDVKKTKLASERKPQVERASLIIEGYRLKHSLSSEPHKDIGI